MSWSNLNSTFSQLNNTKCNETPNRFKRKSRGYYEKLNFSKIISKVQKTSATGVTPLSERNRRHIDPPDDGFINYDPDFDNCCNGCTIKTSPEILPLIIRRRSDSMIPKTLAESQFHSQRNQPDRSILKRISDSVHEQHQTTTSQWKNLDKTILVDRNEILSLEKSIVFSDSDEEPKSDIVNDKNYQIASTSSFDVSDSEENCPTPSLRETNEDNSTMIATKPKNRSVSVVVTPGLKNLETAKKVPCRRGGYVEKLRKTMGHLKSEYSFWYHGKRSGVNLQLPQETDLERNEFRTRIKKITETYGRKFVTIDISNYDDKQSEEIAVFLLDNEKVMVGTNINLELSNVHYKVKGKRYHVGCNKVMLA